MSDREVIIVPAPTANGDLHVGHLSGPYLASDVYARYARATGREVLYSTGIQDTQTYVVTTARRLGTTPAALAEKSEADVRRTLAAIGISIDGFGPADERFGKLLLNFLAPLHSAGRFELRTVNFPYRPRTGEYLMDGHVRGGCPVCLADGCGGVCETCAHPINPDDLIDPRAVAAPDEPVEIRPVPILVLPLEPYRAGLTAYFERFGPAMRPHLLQAAREMLAAPLPYFPITYPTSWGVPAPFPEVPGQVINPAVEAMPAGMYSTAIAAERTGASPGADDELWLAGAGSRVTYFCGFDNTQPFAIAGLALLMAHGDRYRPPEQFVTNEFYELDHEKLSTSRGHVVWGQDLAARVPRDLIRFFLAATSPEHQRTNFSHRALGTVTESRLVRPWNRVADKLEPLLGRGSLPVSGRGREHARLIIDRFAACYRPAGFSLNRAAETLAAQLARLDRLPVHSDDAGDFCYQVEVFVRCAAPILIDLAARMLPDTAIPTGPLATRVTPRPAPRMDRAGVTESS